MTIRSVKRIRRRNMSRKTQKRKRSSLKRSSLKRSSLKRSSKMKRKIRKSQSGGRKKRITRRRTILQKGG